MRDGLKNKQSKKVDEAKIDEEDRLMKPGMGRKLKPGFFAHDSDKGEHEGETLRNSLQTIKFNDEKNITNRYFINHCCCY